MSTVKFKGSTSGEAEVTVVAAAGTPTITLPTASINLATDGSNGQYLKTNGSGTLSFDTPTDTTTPANASVTEAKLNANAPTNDHVLTADDTAAGGFKWAAASAGAALTGSTDNQVVTVTGANAMTGESGLTFDGTHLSITDGNLVIGTSGHGISFAATTDAANGAYGGTMGDELLHDYEYGTWTPVLKFNGGVVGQSYSSQDGRYTKVGNLIHVQCHIGLSAKGSSTGNITMGGLPWLAKSQGAVLMIQGDGLSYGGTQCWCLVGHSNANHYWNVQQGGSSTLANWIYLTHASVKDSGSYYMSGSYTVAD